MAYPILALSGTIMSFLHVLKGDFFAAKNAVEGPPLRFAGWLL